MSDPSLKDLIAKVLSYGRGGMLEMPFSGTPSFFRTNLCNEWSEIDIALLGVPSDAGLSHRPGARYGPQAMRAQSGLIPYINPYTKVIPYELARLAGANQFLIASGVRFLNREIWRADGALANDRIGSAATY